METLAVTVGRGYLATPSTEKSLRGTPVAGVLIGPVTVRYWKFSGSPTFARSSDEMCREGASKTFYWIQGTKISSKVLNCRITDSRRRGSCNKREEGGRNSGWKAGLRHKHRVLELSIGLSPAERHCNNKRRLYWGLST